MRGTEKRARPPHTPRTRREIYNEGVQARIEGQSGATFSPPGG